MEKKSTFEDLNLKDAFLFATAMQDPEICRTVLELILGHPVSKVSVHVEHALLFNSDFRSVRLDVYARDGLQVNYDVEMQNDDKGKLPKRSRFYQAEMDAGALEPGQDFDELKPSYIIFICTFDPFDRNLYRYTFEERCLEYDFPLGDETRKVFLNTKGSNDSDVPAELVQFLHYVERSSDSYVETVTEQRIHHLHERICKLKKSREWRSRYMTLGEYLDKRIEEQVSKQVAERTQEIEKQAAEQVSKQVAERTQEIEKQAADSGEIRMLTLVSRMFAAGEGDMIPRLSTEPELRKQMLEKYDLSPENQ